MSQVKVQGNASGTGVLTVTSPNTNSNYTLTLPAQTGTILTNVSTGTVLQVVQSIITTEFTFSSSTYADATNFNASITPSSASNKILVCLNVCYWLDNYNAGSTSIGGKIVRSGTDIYECQLAYNYGEAENGTTPVTYLDSPATTSAITYKLQVRASSTYNPSRINGAVGVYGAKSSILLMEIAG